MKGKKVIHITSKSSASDIKYNIISAMMESYPPDN